MDKHSHDHCKHENLKYCAHCAKAYCLNCNQEWGGRLGWYYPILSQQRPVAFGTLQGGIGGGAYQGRSLGMAQNQMNSSPVGCKHPENE